MCNKHFGMLNAHNGADIIKVMFIQWRKTEVRYRSTRRHIIVYCVRELVDWWESLGPFFSLGLLPLATANRRNYHSTCCQFQTQQRLCLIAFISTDFIALSSFALANELIVTRGLYLLYIRLPWSASKLTFSMHRVVVVWKFTRLLWYIAGHKMKSVNVRKITSSTGNALNYGH